MKKSFDDIPEGEVLSKPLIYCHFAKYVIALVCGYLSKSYQGN
jgi:hypothetical protein